MPHNHQPTFLAGGSGTTGRRVASRLAALGHPIRIGSRAAPIPFDWERPETWATALRGTRRAYVAYSPDLAADGARDRISEFTEIAIASGVERLVLLSGRGEPAAQAAEQIVLDSPIEATVVRCSFFAQNFSEHFLVDAVRDGVVALPAGRVAEPVIDADDIADVAVAALSEPGHAGTVHELTGPDLLTFDEMAAALSAAAGRPVAYVPVSPADYVRAATAAGMPAAQAEQLAELFAFIFDGHNASCTTGVEDVLGRRARGFGEYATAAAATGVWNVPA